MSDATLHNTVRRALELLRAVGCNSIDPTTIAMVACDPNDWPMQMPGAAAPSETGVAAFRERFYIAAELLQLRDAQPDLKPLAERTDADLRAVKTARDWVAKVYQAHVDALRLELQGKAPAK